MKIRQTWTPLVVSVVGLATLAGCDLFPPFPADAGPDAQLPDAGPPAEPDEPAREDRAWEPYTVEELRNLRAEFKWSDTKELSEAPAGTETVDGQPFALPAIHYVQIYVRSDDQLRELNEMGIHYDLAPLFASEWPSGDEPLTLPFEGDPQDRGGQFAFALIPAVTYNQIRKFSLEGEQTYDAVMLRQVPSEARAPDGSVSWAYLKANLASFAPAYAELTDDGEVVPEPIDDDATKGQKRIGRLLRRFVRVIRDVTRATINGTRYVIGLAARAVLKTTRLRINTYVPERSHMFGSRPKRAWDFGGTYGDDLTLKGVRVYVSGASGLTLYPAVLNDEGRASVDVPDGIQVRVCFEADSPAARFEAGLLRPVRNCKPWFRPNGGSFERTFAVQGRPFYSMAQFIDSREYAAQVLGHRPPKATVQVGFLAEALSSDSRAFVPCLAATRGPVSMVNAYANTLNAVGSVVSLPLGDIVEFGLATDIVMPFDANDSRNVPTHEYGHYVLCTLLNNTNPQTFNVVWSQVIDYRNLNQEEGSQVVALNEGFADWFASQVTSSVNYFALTAPAVNERSNYQFFDFSGPALGQGLEENVGGRACVPGAPAGCAISVIPETNDQNIATVATILHDIIDRGPCGGDVACRNARRSDAAAWVTSGSPVTTEVDPQLDHVGDEKVAMTPMQLADGIRRFANANLAAGRKLSFDNFYLALTEEMLARNYSPGDVCELFALHRPDGQCPTSWTGIVSTTTPLSVSFPSSTGGHVNASATGTGAMCSVNACTTPAGGSVTLEAVAEPGYTFTSWSGCSTQTAPQLVLSNLSSDLICTPTFTPRTWTVSATSSGGGRVTPTSTGVTHGGSVTLEAMPDSGFRFAGYTGGPLCTGADPRLSVGPVTGDVQCTANFVAIPRFTVTFSVLNPISVATLTGVIEPGSVACGRSSCSVEVGQTVNLNSWADGIAWDNDAWTCTNQATGEVIESRVTTGLDMPITLTNIQHDWDCRADVQVILL